MNLHPLRTFIEVARRGSFADVARRQNIAPSIVSRTIAGLEAEIGVRLFNRTTRSLSLTEAGGRYLLRIEAVVEELDDAGNEALAGGTSAAGTLRLTASVAFGQVCLMPVLGAFRAAFPDIKLELLMTDENLDLVAHGIDLAIRLAPDVETHMESRKLFATHYRVCASPAYL